jgi:hypothetical protein
VLATINRDKDLVLTYEGKLFVWLYKNFPGISDRIILNEMAKEPNAKF